MLPGAKSFPHAHFFESFQGFGHGQVDVIEAGNQQNENGQPCQNIDRGDVAIGFQLPLQMRLQVNVGQRLTVDDIVTVLRANPVFIKRLKPGLEIRHGCPFLYFYIGVVIVPAPVGIQVIVSDPP